MLARLLYRSMHWLTLTLRLLDRFTDRGFKLEQFQLRVGGQLFVAQDDLALRIA
jgi:hypothetical protein